MIRTLAALSMRRARHHTLIFHRVLQQTDPMSPGEPTQEWFARLVEMLASNFEMISLDEAVARAEAGRLSGRTISVTFDDGYADNFTVALPILEANQCSSNVLYRQRVRRRWSHVERLDH